MRNKARRTRRVWFSSCISPQIEIDCEAALDTPSEIARNHFVARRAMMLPVAERAARNGGLTAGGRKGAAAKGGAAKKKERGGGWGRDTEKKEGRGRAWAGELLQTTAFSA